MSFSTRNAAAHQTEEFVIQLIQLVKKAVNQTRKRLAYS
jgi:hypothetical protein